MLRSEIAKNAANERWHPKTPRATHSGVLIIGDIELACDVLQDGRRVLRQKTLGIAMGRKQIGGRQRGQDVSDLPIFLTANNLRPYLEKVIYDGSGSLIHYKGINGQRIQGYDATILPEACKAYAKADEDKVLQGNQLKIAKECRAILYGLATVGIVALVDDATGYVEERQRNELQKILEKYISEELREWTKKFPDQFFKQIYRLYGWEWGEFKKNHPQCVGNIINKYIYEKLPPGVLQELKNKNPVTETGKRKHMHHQFLTEDIGDKNLNGQICQVVTLMKVSDNMEQFKNMMEKISN